MLRACALALAVLLTGCGSESGPKTTIFLTAGGECDPGQVACGARDSERYVELAFGERPRPLEHFPIRLRTRGFEPDRVWLRFAMQDMAMGDNRVALLAADGSWGGNATLPLCWRGRREWQVELVLEQGDTHYRARFDFVAGD